MVTDVLRPRLNSELNNYFFHYSMITYAGHIVETKSKNEKKINYDCRTNKRRHWEVFSLRTLSLDVSYYFFPDGTAAYMYMHHYCLGFAAAFCCCCMDNLSVFDF